MRERNVALPFGGLLSGGAALTHTASLSAHSSFPALPPTLRPAAPGVGGSAARHQSPEAGHTHSSDFTPLTHSQTPPTHTMLPLYPGPIPGSNSLMMSCAIHLKERRGKGNRVGVCVGRPVRGSMRALADF